MPSANSLVSKVAKILSQVNATDRQVFKRVVTKTGGDPLLGRGGVVSTTDIPLAPQPAVIWPTAYAPMVLAGASVLPVGDCYMIVSPSAISADELKDKSMSIVFKDSMGVEEVYHVIGMSRSAFQGKAIAFECALASKQR